MDWFSWLSKTSLDPALVHDYALTFTHNELEEGDIAYFSHEFLQSMGISIAKHRLEILKLAWKQKCRSSRTLTLWLIMAIKQAKKNLADHMSACIQHKDQTLLLAPVRSYSSRWKTNMVKRNRRLKAANNGGTSPIGNYPRMLKPTGERKLMLSNEELADSDGSSASDSTRPEADSSESEKIDEEYQGRISQEMKWDAMFQNLTPT